ncbi:hypothetical protein LJR029_005727 [Caballeronia sp. LjRoot29]|uniref:hypothetical protein n=1 Tax=Caballeronia sp. LjRoot29 TaxID=3342315 RepID=UPI003ECCB4B9
MTKRPHLFARFDAFRHAVDIASQLEEFAAGEYVSHEDTYASIQRLFEGSQNPADSESPLNGQIGDELGAIAKECGLARLVRGENLNPYFDVAHVLRDALRSAGNVAVVTGSDARWLSAIRVALAYVSRRDPQRSAMQQIAPRDVTFAHAVNFFTSKGIDLSLVGDEVSIPSSDEWERLANTAWYPLRSLGDTQAMVLLDEILCDDTTRLSDECACIRLQI